MILAVWSVAAGLAGSTPGLAPQQLYCPGSGAMNITITDRPADGACVLVILSADNTEVSRADLPAGGSNEVDLRELFPDMNSLDEAHYLQLIVDAQPVGSALVLEPLVSRPLPVVQNGPRGPVVRTWEPVPESDLTMTGLRVYAERFVKLHTTLGDITIALRPDQAPNTAWNFRFLVDGGFYTQVPFHRVVGTTRIGEGFVIQAGDPTGTGNGGPGYSIDLEPSKLPHDVGVISMARESRDIDSAGSQFFICLSRAATARLDGQYTSFGQTVIGLDVVERIGALETDANQRPLEMPYIESSELIPATPRVPGMAPTWMTVKKKAPDDGAGPREENPER